MFRDQRCAVLRCGSPDFEYVEETKAALAKFIGLSDNWYWALLPNLLFPMKADGVFPNVGTEFGYSDIFGDVAFSWN